MESPRDNFLEPIAISLVCGRFLIFDVGAVTHLRKTHHICGVLIGAIPQVPQQNVFLGLPVELLPEEAKILVEKGAAYVVDDVARHRKGFSTPEEDNRREYIEFLRAEGLQARKGAEEEARKKSEHALAKQASLGSTQKVSVISLASGEATEAGLPYAITPTTSAALSLSQSFNRQWNHPVPPSYSLFRHLHTQNYFIMPGLRFGCDYNVYPGDPLRFHSHFLATGYGWNQEIPLLDIVGGGRLGTGVKKAFLIGGEKQDPKETDTSEVRTFCIEWAGM